MLRVVRGNVGVVEVTSNFRLIQTVREERRVHKRTVPDGCSSNNSRVAEVNVCGSYARGHMPFFVFLFVLSFPPLSDRVMLILRPYSRERIGVRSDACVGRCVGAVRTTSQSLERQRSFIGSSSTQYDPLVHLPSAYCVFTPLRVHC